MSLRRLKQVSYETPSDVSVVRHQDVSVVRLHHVSKLRFLDALSLPYGLYYVFILLYHDLHLVGFHVSLNIGTRNNIVWKVMGDYCLSYCKTFWLVPDSTECTKIFVTEKCSPLFMTPKIK